MGLRVVVADDDVLLREGVASILRGAGHDVVGEAGDAQALTELVHELDADLAVVDIRMPPTKTWKGSTRRGACATPPVVLRPVNRPNGMTPSRDATARVPPMADETGTFFDALGRRGHDPALWRASGTVAIEVAKDRGRRRWLVTIDKGDISVSRTGGPADVTIRAEEPVLRALASGRTSPMAAVLRGTVVVTGDPRLLVLFRRLLPGPPKRRRRR